MLLYSPGGGGRQTPRVAEQTPGTLPSNAPDTPLPSPSPIQAATPLSPASSKPGTPSSTTGTPENTDAAPTKPSNKTDNQATHTVRFDPADGSKPTQSTVKTGTLILPPEKNPVREGFRFDGWTRSGQPFDFRTPILKDTTLKAQWTKITDWTLSPDHGPASGTRLTISPPDRQEPQFAGIHTAGEQTAGLTGDGRIYTWKQDSTPKQVPFPAQAPDGFRYQQVAAGGRRQAALGSDQRIYTWASGQATPTILDTSRNTQFTSISIKDDFLLAIDRQGQVHAYQASDDDSKNLNPKFTEQATTSLPVQARAVLAVASGSQALIVDADGQAWTWDASKTGNAKPERVKQDPGMRFTQAQTLSRGFLLLGSQGQLRYLADSATSSTAVGLPDGAQASQITCNDNQAIITGTDGRAWAWKPGKTPIRADKGNQQYMQATAAGSRVTAISRQGDMLTWSLDGQDQPGKPARLDTATASILESASMDGQALTLSRNNDSWQADMPVRKPGQATILITGRQDDKPFTRSLRYTVDQPLTRDDQQDSTYTVHFNTGEGGPTPLDQSIQPVYGRVQRPTTDPTRQGYQFDGWFTGEVAYDFSRPVTGNLTLTAKWTPIKQNSTWSISPNKGSQLGGESTTITPPDSASRGIRFSQISGSENEDGGFSLAVGSDGNAYAWGYNNNGQLGDGTTSTRQTTPVMVRKPAGAPADFTYVQVSAGYDHSLALGSDGNAYAWGDNGYGQLGDGTGGSQKTPVRVKTPDRKTYPDLPADFTYIQVSAGGDHSLALGSDGNAYAWGDNGYGQLGDGTGGSQKTPVRVKTPDRKTYPDLPADFTYIQVSAGGDHSLALGSDGNAYAWGDNGYGQLGDGTRTDHTAPVKVGKPERTSTDFTYVQVSAGGQHSLALSSDGNAYAWGWNGGGQLGDGTKTSWTTPVIVEKPADFTYVQVSAGGDHSLALGSNGYAYTWGCNLRGQLGNSTSGNYANSSVPVLVRDPTNLTDKSQGLKAAQVSAGYHHSLALGSNGNAYAWGYNYYGQLGNGTIYQSSVPVPVSFNLQLAITGVRFDQTPASGLAHGDGSSVTVTTPAHLPGTVTVSVDYTLGGAPQTPDTSLRYTYLPAGVLPRAGGQGILLALATGMTGMGGVLASRRHRQETRRLVHASHE